MPCANVHLLVADLAWDRWTANGGQRFDLTVENRDAFLHGSLAPDVGFIPGVDRIVSELAHYHRPADLARALMERAASEREKAFAWGWVGHVLADVEIHPLVGRSVGERLHGTRDRRMNAAEDVETHVSVEVGLDIVVRSRAPATSRPPARPLFPASSIGWISDALDDVYGVRWSPEVLATWHRTAVARTRNWPFALNLLERGAGEWRARRRPIAAGFLGGVSRMAAKRTPLRGFLTPRKPPAWVLDEFDASVGRVVEDFERLTRNGIAELPNRNLETGLDQAVGDPHPGSIAVREKLSTLKAADGEGIRGGRRDRAVIRGGS